MRLLGTLIGAAWAAFIDFRPKGRFRGMSDQQRRQIVITYLTHLQMGDWDFIRASILHVRGYTDDALCLLERIVATATGYKASRALIEIAEIHASEGRLTAAHGTVVRAIAEETPSLRPVAQACGGLLLLRYGDDLHGEPLCAQAFDTLIAQPLPANPWLCLLAARYSKHLRLTGRSGEASGLLARLRSLDPSLFEPTSLLSSLLTEDTAA